MGPSFGRSRWRLGMSLYIHGMRRKSRVRIVVGPVVRPPEAGQISLMILKRKLYRRSLWKGKDSPLVTYNIVHVNRVTTTKFKLNALYPPMLDHTSHHHDVHSGVQTKWAALIRDRKSTRLNSSHVEISYAV